MNNFEDVVFSGPGRIVLGTVGGLIVASLIFHAGVVAGERSARPQFGGDPGKNFRVFLAPGVALPHGFIQSGHGAVGEVESVASSTFIIETREGTTQTVNATDTSQLKVGSQVLIIGEPDESGHINAKIIRLLPPPPQQ